MSSSEHSRRAIFQIYNVQNLKITRITTLRICNIVYQAGSRWDPKCVFNFLRFFERTFYKSNYIIFILSWCGTHTKIRSKLVDIVTAGSQKITHWGPQRTPLGIIRVKEIVKLYLYCPSGPFVTTSGANITKLRRSRVQRRLSCSCVSLFSERLKFKEWIFSENSILWYPSRAIIYANSLIEYILITNIKFNWRITADGNFQNFALKF